MSLIDAAFWTKIGIRIVAIVLVVFVVGYFGWVYISNPPRRPEQIFKADLKCGLLPELIINKVKNVDISTIPISEETVATTIKETPQIAYVYELDVQGETFSTKDKALQLADRLDFKNIAVQKPASTQYVWRDVAKSRTLQVDTDTLNFDYFYDEAKLPKTPNDKLPQIAAAPGIATQFLSSVGLYSSEFSTGNVFTYLVNINGSTIKEANSLGEAQLVRVDFQKSTVALQYDKRITQAGFPLPTDFESIFNDPNAVPKEQLKQFTVPRVSQTPITGNMQVYIQKTEAQVQDSVFRMYVRNWRTKEVPCGTYQIYQPSEAISRIKEGKGSLVYLAEDRGDHLNPQNLPKLTSLRIYQVDLAYLETIERQSYLQPIYVASGQGTFDNGRNAVFAIYIPAIKE